MLTHEDLVVMAQLVGWVVLVGAFGYLTSCTLFFVLTRIARKRQIRRMHQARKADPK